MRVNLSRAFCLAIATAAGLPRVGVAQAGAALNAANVGERTAVRGSVDGNDIVRTARQYLGVRYQLGGSTPKAFDCSGFVRYVFAEHGITLPRTAHQQAALGVAPFPGDLRTGDLLFFYGGRGAQHIAIYVGGDTIIHASSSGKRVKLDVLSHAGRRKSWFRQRLIAVRRVLPLQGVFYLPSVGSASGAGSAPIAGGAEQSVHSWREAGPQPREE
jgi:cell wall-associated NlpC family hydrolase